MTTQFVYFDLGNVILNFDHAVGTRQVALAASISEELVGPTIFESGLQIRYETGLITSQQFHEEFCDATQSSPKFDDLMVACSDIFTLNEPIVPVIDQLVQANIRIGILSNTCEAHWMYVKNHYSDLVDQFAEIVLSYEVQSMKPDSKIYDHAIRSANAVLAKAGQEPVKPADIFFMDDRLDNVAGAVAAGIDAEPFRTAGELADQLKARKVIP